jgi:DtxR family transcriptional regulator, Mn-dependent transcriptional regulator
VSKPDLSEAIQDYLKEIYKLEASGARATTTAVARSLGVAPSSATAMVKKLAVLGLVDHAPYRGVELTEAGRKIALEVVRHHRLLEVYLAETLGLGIDAVHAEADRLEHVISEELEARIDQALGFPTHDPHGDPIPDAALNLKARSLRPLDELEPGESATVRRIPDGDAGLLRYLADLELVPGCRLVVRASDLPAGPVTVDVAGREHELSRELAGQIGVA